ncbi:hypothetical protein MKZ38_007085 [Zalerion maritima]|uniref:dual-specificity kinase n=1 Tax=Zalerion maritima TaxID=339359 RepID=A0AAD5RI83_9PEZI|nr:hypothetical protein MKZ38_007085 [Zalerion maritima]
MLHASSSNNHSLFSFGRNANAGSNASQATNVDNSGSFDFLPSVSFDDLHSSLESASTDFKLTQFPSPTGQGSILEVQGMVGSNSSSGKAMGEHSNVTHSGGTTRVAIPPSSTRTARSGSLLRRPSTSGNKPGSNISGAATNGGNSNTSEAPTGPSSTRPRRQSHYPPLSNAHPGIVRPPRKSVGPGGVDSSSFGQGRASRSRRPSLNSNAGSEKGDTTRTSIDISSSNVTDMPRNLTGARAMKAKSVQPPPRTNASLTVGDALTPERNRLSTIAPRSPRTGGGRGAGSGNQVSGNNRVSMMSHTSHATGLGARTISPTDTRRMKRMSTMPQNPSIAQVANAPPPPPPPPPDTRPTSRSPSMIPRKSITPSSSRTTPDVNRKSYSSGLSVTSVATSHNTARTSTGSIQGRIPQSSSLSRLPAPKNVVVHNNSMSVDDDEDVPPVPAIPKAYESPKDSPAENCSFLDKRKSNLAFDASSINSTSTGSLSNQPSLEPPGQPKMQRKGSIRKASNTSIASEAESKKKAGSAPAKKVQSIRLPPITLQPLSTPTAAKIAALQEQSMYSNRHSPPPARRTAKTPTTPMTASKSTFFGRHRADDKAEVHQFMRSSSSIHNIHEASPTPVSNFNADMTAMSEFDLAPLGSNKRDISPFLSSSAPKGGDLESLYLKRSKTGGDITSPGDNTTSFDFKAQENKPSGPRSQAHKHHTVVPPTTLGPVRTFKSPPPPASPEEPQTPSSISSLRRKLSLSWKRSNSKASVSHPPGMPDKSAEQGSHGARQDSMPPPRLPISATLNNLNNAREAKDASTAVIKPNGSTSTYLESRRRKSSASSLNQSASHDRKRSDGGGWPGTQVHNHSINESMVADASTDRLTLSRNSSVAQKILKPKPSVQSIRPQHNGVYIAEMDKDDMTAEDEMRRLASRRKETELHARTLDTLRKRATPKERVGPQEAIRIAMLNIYERGEIVDYQDIYFCGTQNARKVIGDLKSEAPNFGYDDERGDYTIVPGDHLAYRFEIIDVLGKGSFGQVVRCIDHKLGILVAVKIIRNKKRFHQQALVEVNILAKLREWDPDAKHSMVHFTDHFYFRGHLCISTELLDMNLYEFIKSNNFRGFSLKLIRRFTKQMLSSLNLLKGHKVIHCDLKPENILLRHPMHSEIKVIDFGSSCFENEKVYTYIQSRFYRSPEVILGMTYGMPIDMWSLGCILAELYTGVPIFPGENEQEQLACIMEVFGPPEKHLIEKSTRKKLFFDSMGKPRLTVSSKGRRRRPSSKTLQQALKCDDDPFVDFIARCLRWDPERRMKPDEAIYHEFLTGRRNTMPVPRRDGSPVKRHNTISAPRPLPEPPGGPKIISMRSRDPSNASPQKFGSVGRRTSGVNGNASHGMGHTKRTSTGAAGLASSSLPRVAGRSVSSKQDLASAGASAAMGRRA